MSCYSPSSFNSPAMNMHCYYEHIQCPKGHFGNKEILKKIGRKVFMKCKICGKTFWIEEFKRPKSISR